MDKKLVVTLLAVVSCGILLSPTCSAKKAGRYAQRSGKAVQTSRKASRPVEPLYSSMLEEARPANSDVVHGNPPPLFIPGERGGVYRIALSSDPGFPEGKTVVSEAKPWCIYNHDKPLGLGKWYWRYQQKSGSKWGAWSKTNTFTVDSSSYLKQTKKFADFLGAIPETHPRVGLKGESVEKFRAQAAKHPYTERFVNSCKASLTNEPSMHSLRRGYYLTGDEEFAEKGAKLLKNQLEDYTPGHNFLSVRKMGTLATMYDAFYGKLDKDTRRMFVEKAKKSLNCHTRRRGHLELRGFDNHFWQMSMYGYLRTALVLAHEHPDTHEHLEYAFNLALAKFPIVGPTDGGWANGHGYFHVNDVTLANVPKDMQVGGIDLFTSHPWFKSTSDYLSYCTGFGAIVPGFGDKSERRRYNMYSFEMNMIFRQVKDNPLAAWTLKKEKRRNSRAKFSDWLYITQNKVREDWVKAPKPDHLPQAAVFRGTGIAAMHSNMDDPKNNIVVYLKSSPYGSAIAHMTASQNCFNISYKGHKLFFHTGNYKAGFSSPHIHSDYRHTRSQNGLLVNGLSQGYGMNYFGWIKRFADNDQIAYACGDASQAYGRLDKNKRKGDWAEYGYGNLETPLTTFDRHLAFCRPDLLLVYDVLEAKEKADFSLMFNSRSNNAELSDDGVFTVENGKGRGVLQVFSKDSMKHSFSDSYITPYKNEKPSRARYDAPLKTKRARFLTVIQMGDKEAKAAKKVSINNGVINALGFSVKAELDPAKPPLFIVEGNKARLKVDDKEDPVLNGTVNNAKSTQVAEYLSPIY